MNITHISLISTFVFFSLFAHSQTRCGKADFETKDSSTTYEAYNYVEFISDTVSNSTSSSFKYKWFVNGYSKPRFNKETFRYFFDTAQKVNICLIVTDSLKNCGDTFCQTINIVPNTQCFSSFKVSNGSNDCYKLFSVSGNQVDSFNLDFGDGQKYNGSNNNSQQTHFYPNNGKYKATLTVFGLKGQCKVTKDTTFAVTGCGASTSCRAGFYGIKTTFPFDQKPCFFTNNSSFDSKSTISTKWLVDDSLISDSFNLTYTFQKTGVTKICLVIEDSANQCTDTLCRDFLVLATNCGMTYEVKDTLDSCSVVFILKNYNPLLVDSFTFHWGNKDSTKFTTSHPKRVVYSFWDIRNNYTYYPRLVTYGMDGECATNYSQAIKLVKCGNKDYCKNSIYGSAIPDSLAKKDSLKYGLQRTHSFSDYTAWLIQKKGNTLSVVDSSTFDSSLFQSFNFSVCPDTFYIKAALTPKNRNYKYMLPTYYGGSITWQGATPIVFDPNEYLNKKLASVMLAVGTNPGGPGFIAGNVKKGANKKAGEPISGVQILLLNEKKEPVAYTYSAKDGSFKIDDLAMGKYHLFAEVIGLETDGIDLTLTEENKQINNIEIEVNSKDVVTSLIEKNAILSNPISIFPNPANNYIQVKIDNLKGQIILTDINGRVLKTSLIDNETIINLNEYKTGVYILTFKSNMDQTFQKRLIIK
ncbi:MAG: T9SS type A sorting domain-containing protein [Bacteroidia bacterium]